MLLTGELLLLRSRHVRLNHLQLHDLGMDVGLCRHDTGK